VCVFPPPPSVLACRDRAKKNRTRRRTGKADTQKESGANVWDGRKQEDIAVGDGCTGVGRGRRRQGRSFRHRVPVGLPDVPTMRAHRRRRRPSGRRVLASLAPLTHRVHVATHAVPGQDRRRGSVHRGAASGRSRLLVRRNLLFLHFDVFFIPPLRLRLLLVLLGGALAGARLPGAHDRLPARLLGLVVVRPVDLRGCCRVDIDPNLCGGFRGRDGRSDFVSEFVAVGDPAGPRGTVAESRCVGRPPPRVPRADVDRRICNANPRFARRRR